MKAYTNDMISLYGHLGNLIKNQESKFSLESVN